jgi:hypothetical protein
MVTEEVLSIAERGATSFQKGVQGPENLSEVWGIPISLGSHLGDGLAAGFLGPGPIPVPARCHLGLTRQPRLSPDESTGCSMEILGAYRATSEARLL